MTINKDFLSLSKDDFDKTISAIANLSMVIAPLLIKINKDGKGLEDAAEFTIDLLIAADALTEIKMQVHGEEREQNG